MNSAAIYHVRRQAVMRNQARFPLEFSFQLTQDEWDALRSQSVTSNAVAIMGSGGRRYPPRVFTESGAVALAMVLDSDRAVAASIQVVRVFVRLRRVIDVNKTLARRIDELAAKIDEHDRAFAVVFHELRQPEAEPDRPKGRIGYRTSKGSRT